MEEKLYRQSRLCRLLGNPVVYSIVAVLHEQDAMTPTQIVEVVGRSLGRVSALLAALRLADVVRYETAGGHTNYRLKHRAETGRLLKALADFVAMTSEKVAVGECKGSWHGWKRQVVYEVSSQQSGMESCFPRYS